MCLVDALAYGYRDIFESRKAVKEKRKPKLSNEKVAEIEPHLDRAARLRMAVVYPPCYGADAAQYIKFLASSPCALVSSTMTCSGRPWPEQAARN